MKDIRACNVQDMRQRMQQLDKRLCQHSPETAALFRERMQAVLSDAPRIGISNSRCGIFATETVAAIVHEAIVVLSARGLDANFPEDVT